MSLVAPLLVGVVEPVAFPDLGIERVFAKIDSGADLCVLHALGPCLTGEGNVEFTPPFWRMQPTHDSWREDGLRRVRAPLLERRWVRNSSGQQEERFVILTTLALAEIQMSVAVTLTARTGMRTPALIGRLALASAPRPIHIDPSSFNLTGKDDAAATPIG